MNAVAEGQTYRWMGADVHVDEIDEKSGLAKITIRQDGCPDWQKWTPATFPPEAELVDPPRSEHNGTCWQIHDDCALRQAREKLEALLHAGPVPGGAIDRLRALRGAIDDHARSRCPALGLKAECFFVKRAREFLRGDWP